MKHLLDARVAQQIRDFSLRFTCDACAHARADESCSLEYPNDEHRLTPALSLAIDRGTGGESLVFCKEFELG
jgi:hypothetical protein